MTLAHLIARLDQINEQSEEIKHESYQAIRDAIPPDAHVGYERSIAEQVSVIQKAVDVLWLEIREIELAGERNRPLTSAADSLWTVAADRGFES